MIIDQITKIFSDDQINPLTLILGVTGLIFYVAGYIQFKHPPKKINSLYGYRTKTSMRSQEIWDFSQTFSAKKIQQLGVYLFFGGILAYFMNIDQFFAMWTGISLITALPILMIFQIEKELKRRFPKT
jgi:uncharacterized membrane protein